MCLYSSPSYIAYCMYRIGSAFFTTTKYFEHFHFQILKVISFNFFSILLLHTPNSEFDSVFHLWIRLKFVFELVWIVFGIWYLICYNLISFQCQSPTNRIFKCLLFFGIRKKEPNTMWKIDLDFERFVIWLWLNYFEMQFIVFTDCGMGKRFILVCP